MPEGMSRSSLPGIVTHKQYHAIVAGDSIVVLLVVLKLNNVMCGKVGHILRVCHNRQQKGGRDRGYTTNLVDGHATQADNTQNTEHKLFPI